MTQVLTQTNSRGTNLANWLNGHGGDGLEKALSEPQSIIPLIRDAGLRGLGGSGFPTFKKWEFVAQQAPKPDKYLICNGNEDEPGTFKDAFLLTETPNQVIEGTLIAAIANQINKIVSQSSYHT